MRTLDRSSPFGKKNQARLWIVRLSLCVECCVWFGGYCSLSVVRCVLFGALWLMIVVCFLVVCRALFVVCCVLSAAWLLLNAVCCVLVVASSDVHLVSIVRCLRRVVCCLLLVVRFWSWLCVLYVACCVLFVIWCYCAWFVCCWLLVNSWLLRVVLLLTMRTLDRQPPSANQTRLWMVRRLLRVERCVWFGRWL